MGSSLCTMLSGKARGARGGTQPAAGDRGERGETDQHLRAYHEPLDTWSLFST